LTTFKHRNPKDSPDNTRISRAESLRNPIELFENMSTAMRTTLQPVPEALPADSVSNGTASNVAAPAAPVSSATSAAPPLAAVSSTTATYATNSISTSSHSVKDQQQQQQQQHRAAATAAAAA